jgi:ABC-type transport system involved in multi-copper enzyme maturation permease subunit
MLKIFGIFEMTVKKIKEPAFMLLFALAAFIGYCVSEMEALSFQEDHGILFGLISLEQGETLLAGFVIILFMSLIVAIFAGSSDIPKDIDSRMIMLILGKPITRIQYLIGKYLGIVCICLLFFFIAAISTVISHLAKTGEMFSFALLFRQCFLVLALFPFVAITMMISTFLSDISAMIVSTVYLALSVFISAISVFVDMLPRSLEVVSVVHVVAYFFPNFFYFFNSFKFVGVVVFSLFFYSLSMTVVFLMIAAARLNKRDMI